MIFVTVGTQLPFDRLLRSVDQWAEKHSDIPVFAQVGDSEYKPQYMECVQNLGPQEYKDKFEAASVVVSHVGMGTIISGLECAKPLVLMPRLASLGEHRNDHQLGTAEKFKHFDLIDVVESEGALQDAISARLDKASDESEAVKMETSPALLARLQEFVYGG